MCTTSLDVPFIGMPGVSSIANMQYYSVGIFSGQVYLVATSNKRLYSMVDRIRDGDPPEIYTRHSMAVAVDPAAWPKKSGCSLFPLQERKWHSSTSYPPLSWSVISVPVIFPPPLRKATQRREVESILMMCKGNDNTAKMHQKMH